MRLITLAELRKVVRDIIAEADEPKAGKGKEKKDEEPLFTCARHSLGLFPMKRWVDAKEDAGQERLVQPFGPMSPGQSRQVAAPTMKVTPPGSKTKRKLVVGSWVCPLWGKPGPYAKNPKTGEGHACDYHISARRDRPGQKYPHEARGNVAEEEGVLFKPINPRRREKDLPLALLDMIDLMAMDSITWKDVTEQGKRRQFKKVKAKHPKTFTSDDIVYLSFAYPRQLMTQKKEQGEDYTGQEPYFVDAATIFRLLLSKGWELAKPEKDEPRRITPPSMPEPYDPLMRSMPSGPKAWEFRGQEDELPWYASGISDDDEDMLGVPDEDEDEDVEGFIDDDEPITKKEHAVHRGSQLHEALVRRAEIDVHSG